MNVPVLRFYPTVIIANRYMAGSLGRYHRFGSRRFFLVSTNSHFRKTAKGIEEIDTRKYKLSPRLRSVLLLIFSSKSVAEIREQAQAIGAPDDFLDQLIAGGFIEQTSGEPQTAGTSAAPASTAPSSPAPSTPIPMADAERFVAAHRFIDQTVMEAGGLKSYMFQLKFQKCGNVAELKALLPEYEKFMFKQLGEASAKVYVNEVSRLLE